MTVIDRPFMIIEECKSVLDNMDPMKKKTIATDQTYIEKRMDAAEVWVDKFSRGTFIWFVDKISQRRANHEHIRSEYFHSNFRPYKMALEMILNGRGDVADSGLTIELLIYPDIRDRFLNWPFEADVTITINNRATPEACKMVTRHCTMNSWDKSGAFDFFYLDLFDASLLAGDCFMVECRVDF